MNLRRVIAVACLGVALAGCAGDPNTGTGPKENTGTLVGAFTGAALGSQFGGSGDSRATGALGGAAFGGLIGNRIGSALDDDDRQRAYVAQVQALESGQSGTAVSWRNADSGRHGAVVPGPVFHQNAMTCRQYTHTVYIDGRPQVTRRTACRNPDGNWIAVS
jgi:surface antigen